MANDNSNVPSGASSLDAPTSGDGATGADQNAADASPNASTPRSDNPFSLQEPSIENATEQQAADDQAADDQAADDQAADDQAADDQAADDQAADKPVAEENPASLDEDEDTVPWTRQSINIPDGPITETIEYQTYPANRFTHEELDLGDDDLMPMLRNMLLQRRFEERCRQMYQQQKISGFLHLYIGQEAVSTGSVYAIRLGEDSIITAYRDHGMGLAMGMDPNVCMAELFGKKTGSSKGKGGSMHFFDAEKRMFGGHAIVGAHLPVGAGIAFAHKYRGEDNVCLCFFGDGGMAQGAYREALNLAGIYDLPIVFICENNQYAMGTAVDRVQAEPDLFKHGRSFDMPCSLASGMDVFSVNKAVKEHVDMAREGQPSMLEIRTYRYQGHSISDPAKYRKEGELDARKSEDAIVRLEQYIIDAGIATDSEIETLDDEIKQEVLDAIEFAENSDFPDDDAIYEDVYAQKDYPFIA